MLAALARGNSELSGLLTGDDVKSSARVLRQLGADISAIGDATVTVEGRRFTSPPSRLFCGNSGTTARLMLGILAGQNFSATLTGDASLRRRPMRRVTEPLKQMGADITEWGDGLPLTIRGGKLRGLTYASPVASAQVKSALLFAGLTGRVSVTVREPYRSRDHTERLLAYLGFDTHDRDGAVVFEPPIRPSAHPPINLSVPGDISSAAFLVAAAILADGGELLIENVGVNPTRTGFIVVLERMGAHVERVNLRDEGGEPVADLAVRPAPLRATEVTARSATGSPPSSRRFTRSTCAPMRSSTTMKPVRVGLTPTFSMTSSPASARTAAATRNAALDGSPGTASWKVGMLEWPDGS